MKTLISATRKGLWLCYLLKNIISINEIANLKSF